MTDGPTSGQHITCFWVNKKKMSKNVTLYKPIRFFSELHYSIFRCITRYFLLLGRPGAGYITNVGYTLLKSDFFYNYG